MANLTESAMLVHLRTRQWTGTKTDKRIRDAAVQKHAVQAAAVKGGQKLLVGSRLEKVQAAYGACSREHLARTLPWLDSGERVLSSAMYQDYMSAIRRCKDELDGHLAEFLAWYTAEYVGGFPESREALNGLWDYGDYPRPERMARRFVLEPEVLPFPSAEDFRVDLGAAELARVRANIETAVSTAIEAAMGDVWARIRDVIGHLGERMRAYDPSGDRVVGKFHDTVISNVRELVELLPGLNVTGDPAVADITAAAAGMLAKLPEAGSAAGKDDAAAKLREDDGLRAQVADEADAILAKMADFV